MHDGDTDARRRGNERGVPNAPKRASTAFSFNSEQTGGRGGGSEACCFPRIFAYIGLPPGRRAREAPRAKPPKTTEEAFSEARPRSHGPATDVDPDRRTDRAPQGAEDHRRAERAHRGAGDARGGGAESDCESRTFPKCL